MDPYEAWSSSLPSKLPLAERRRLRTGLRLPRRLLQLPLSRWVEAAVLSYTPRSWLPYWVPYWVPPDVEDRPHEVEPPSLDSDPPPLPSKYDVRSALKVVVAAVVAVLAVVVAAAAVVVVVEPN